MNLDLVELPIFGGFMQASSEARGTQWATVHGVARESYMT